MRTKIITDDGFKNLLLPETTKRFWSHVNQASKKGACWNWKGSTNGIGYGQVQMRRVFSGPLLCHRVAWMISRKRRIPQGRYILHECNNPLCCNPEHLKIGNQFDNMIHASKCERTFRPAGELSKLAKLNNEKVFEIRKRYAIGDVLTTELAKEFGVTSQNIGYIVHRKSWRHI